MQGIAGIGTEIVECVRIGQLIQRYEELFLRRVYTTSEIQYCSARRLATQHYAARWAAKQAVLKAMGLAWRNGVRWTELEIPAGPSPAFAQLRGTLRTLADQKRVSAVQVSWSYCRTHAVAFAIAWQQQFDQNDTS